MEMDDSPIFRCEQQTLSPQASTDEKSLHRNWQQNRESLQKRLSIRRPVDDLVNNGIMMSPLKTPPCYAERMRQLERAKTTDILKQKIQHRPDAQSLVDRHILPEWPPDEIGGSPQVFEQQQLLRRTELMSSLNAKLENRPGSLEMAEKGLLPLAPPMQTLLRDGSISYPRVDETVSEIDELDTVVSAPLPQSTHIPSSINTIPGCVVTASVLPPPPSVSVSVPTERNTSVTSVSSSCRRQRSHTPHGISSRSRKATGLGTSKVGNFVFHTYNPPKKQAASVMPVISTPDPVFPKVDIDTEFKPAIVTANTARQIQQAEYLRLQESEDKQNVLMQQLVHDIRSRHDGGSPMKVQRNEPVPSSQPSSMTSSAGFVAFSGLASLNVQQLKEECRRYKVSRTGNKMNLIRNLEPFQQEILRKYVLSATTSPTLGSPAGSQATVTAGLVTSNGISNCVEDQSMRHSSSAPQLNLASATKIPAVPTDDLTAADGTSSQGQWPTQQPTATTLILLNQAGPMTLQPVLVTSQGMVPQTHPPPPPPPPPPNQTLLIRQTQQPQLQHHSQPSSPPEQIIQTPVKDEIDDETELIRRMEELERLIVQNIQESDAYKASHHGNRAEHIERQRQILMINYTTVKRQAKAQLQERIDNTRQHLIELCENEATFKDQGNVEALDALEPQRALVLQEYNRLDGLMAKIKANPTPPASVSTESRIRSLTESIGSNIPSIPLNRSMTVTETDPSRTFVAFPSTANGTTNESLSTSKHVEKRLPSVEFQILNEVINQDHIGSKVVHGKPQLNDSNGMTEPSLCDFTNWLNEAVVAPYEQTNMSPQQQLHLVSQTLQTHSHPNGCNVDEIPMSPMQTDFSSRCSTPHRPAHTDPSPGAVVDVLQGQGQFNFEEFLCNPNMDITFPSLGGHQSAASMTEQILTPNTQNALYNFIQPGVVDMETDNDVNDVFAP